MNKNILSLMKIKINKLFIFYKKINKQLIPINNNKNKYEKSHLYIKNELLILNYILIYK